MPSQNKQTDNQSTNDNMSETHVEDTKSTFQQKYEHMMQLHKDSLSSLKEMKSLAKELMSEYRKDVKKAKRSKRSKSSSNPNKEPSGFNKPTPVPEKIREFLGLEEDAELPRTQVTKRLYDYIKDNGLQDESDKRTIKPNDELRELFDLEDGDTIEFKNFQSHMKRLYPKKGKKEVESEDEPEPEPEPEPPKKVEKKEKREKKDRKEKRKERKA
jgi:chromatin remodeling complex protein RSC6